MTLANPMTKMNSKKFIALALSLAISLSVAGNVFAFGAIDTLLQAKKKAEGFKEDAASKGICLRIDELSSNISGRMDEKESSIESKIQEKLHNLEKNRGRRDGELAEFRNEADQWREENYNILESKAETSEQKQAVEDFKTAIETAVKTRRTAINTAIDDFRDGVDQAITDRKSSIEEAAKTYRNSVRMAYQQAQSECDNGIDSKTVRANLHASLKATREKFLEDRKGVDKLQIAMKNLIAVKKQAFEKAITDFKTAVRAAVAELKKSLPESGE